MVITEKKVMDREEEEREREEETARLRNRHDAAPRELLRLRQREKGIEINHVSAARAFHPLFSAGLAESTYIHTPCTFRACVAFTSRLTQSGPVLRVTRPRGTRNTTLFMLRQQ